MRKNISECATKQYIIMVYYKMFLYCFMLYKKITPFMYKVCFSHLFQSLNLNVIYNDKKIMQHKIEIYKLRREYIYCLQM